MGVATRAAKQLMSLAKKKDGGLFNNPHLKHCVIMLKY